MNQIISIVLVIIILIGMIPFGILTVSAEGSVGISVDSVNAMLDSTAEV